MKAHIIKRCLTFITVFAGIILIQACGRELPTEAGCNFVQNSSLQRVSWDQNLPVQLYLDASVPADYAVGIKTAVDQWNVIGQKIRGRNFFNLRNESRGSATPTQDNVSKVYVLNTWEENKPTEQARTTIYWSGSRIYEADIRINRKNFDFYMGETPDFTKVHLESLMVHELGHVLGLAHTSIEDSVMQVSLANGKARTELASDDLASIQCEY